MVHELTYLYRKQGTSKVTNEPFLCRNVVCNQRHMIFQFNVHLEPAYDILLPKAEEETVPSPLPVQPAQYVSPTRAFGYLRWKSLCFHL